MSLKVKPTVFLLTVLYTNISGIDEILGKNSGKFAKK